MGAGQWSFLARYVLIDEKGPDHAKMFEMEVRIGKKPYGRAVGHE